MTQLRKAWVDICTAPISQRIHARDLMNFAAGVQSHREAYFDDSAAGGIASFPTFSSRISWHAVSELWKVMHAQGCAPEVTKRQVHYRTEIRNFRDFAAGEEIIVQARVKDMVRHRAGTLMATEVTMKTPAGELVCLEMVEGLLRGINCDEPSPQTMRATRSLGGEETVTIWESLFQIPRLLPYHYDGCADIHFPIHSSPAYARGVGLPGIVVQGSATLAVCVDKLINWLDPSDERVHVSEISATYGAYLLPETQVRLVAQANEHTEAYTEVVFSLVGDNHQEIIRHGYLKFCR